MPDRTYYITTPIYYVNDVPHIGHAYTTIAADVAARFKRLAGYDTFFLTGTDEHGINVERVAQRNGVTPQAWTDRVAAEFRTLWEVLNISHDDFIRTTEPRHERVAAGLFQTLYDKGDIYLGKYEGWYCASCESFYLESELGPDKTCPVHTGRKTEWTAEESYLFRLSKYQDWWLRYVAEHPGSIEPEARRNEVTSFVRSGLKDLSVSRSTFTWGVPVPFDRRHVIYVWIDALTNYISALGYPDGERFARFWPASVHLVGKEIVRFHAVYWPIMLHAAGIAVPEQTFAHGWLTFGGQRFSKSLGIVIDPAALAREIAAEAGVDVPIAVDALRYFLLREIPFGADGDFNKVALVHRFNADLANDYGNLLNRTIPQVERHFGGAVPAAGPRRLAAVARDDGPDLRRPESPRPARAGGTTGCSGRPPRPWPRSSTRSSRGWTSPGRSARSGACSASRTSTWMRRRPGARSRRTPSGPERHSTIRSRQFASRPSSCRRGCPRRQHGYGGSSGSGHR